MQILNDSNVEYVGYLIPHPMEIKMKIRIALKNNKFTEKECKEVLNNLPMEFAVEAQKLLEISLEGSVG